LAIKKFPIENSSAEQRAINEAEIYTRVLNKINSSSSSSPSYFPSMQEIYYDGKNTFVTEQILLLLIVYFSS
jgi:hypothetical protein